MAISAAAQNIAERCLVAIGRPELRADPRFSSPAARAEHADEIDALMRDWIRAHDNDEVVQACGTSRRLGAACQSVGHVHFAGWVRARGGLLTV